MFIQAEALVPRIPEVVFPQPVDWSIREGECWTVYGANGSGKTLLAEVLKGRYGIASGTISYPFMDEIRAQGHTGTYPRQWIETVSFQSTYTMSNFRDSFYQQRFNSQETDYYPTVRELLSRHADAPAVEEVLRTMDLSAQADERLVSLSSGQLRRLIICGALLRRPRMLIFDHPFIGLDEAARGRLNELFVRLVKEGTQLLFLIPTLRDIPPCTTHVLWLDACRVLYQGPKAGFHAEEKSPASGPHLPKGGMEPVLEKYRNVVEMKGLDIRYGTHVFQQGLDWTIRKGEKWALLGPNGSGKSTLLSFIFADNPQAYALPVSLFDRRRGSGESIWDIKKRIGYTSSEMHLYYLENIPCLAVLQSGFFDSVGLFCKCSEEQTQLARKWLGVLGLSHLENRSFLRVSSGEQRLLLFGRALIKNPQVLILDEPFHGLDYATKRHCLNLIAEFAAQPDRSLIFVTHYREEIPACVDHVFELKSPFEHEYNRPQ